MTTLNVRLVLMILATQAFGCGAETADGPLARVGNRRVGATGPGPPPTPAEFRFLDGTQLPDISIRFEGLRENPGDAALRQELSDMYKDAGFHWAANFFQASLDPLFNRIVEYPTADSPVAWVEPRRGDSEYRAENKEVWKVCGLVLNNEYQKAVDLAAELMLEGPYSLQEVAAWSYAALWYIVAEAGPIEEAAPEIAFRVFLTSLEDARMPDCVADRVSGFQLISGFFTRWGDPVSAYTAAAIEHELYSDWPDEEKSDAYTELLRIRIRDLRQNIKPYVVEDT